MKGLFLVRELPENKQWSLVH